MAESGIGTIRMPSVGVRAEFLRPLPLFDALEERPPTTSTFYPTDHASEGMRAGASLVRRGSLGGPRSYSDPTATR